MKYRCYIDEVGNASLKVSTADPNDRYLSLTGVIVGLDYVKSTLSPSIEELKNDFFDSHPDEPIVLHRKEIVNKNYPFENLRDAVTEKAFNKRITNILMELEYLVITVVIDKKEHIARYKVWQHHPYHYCLKVLVERYVLWLESLGAVGDVMVESRGGREDRKLKESFSRLYSLGSDYVPVNKFETYLTSRKLKVKPKMLNISGLQLADLIAHPSFKATLARKHNKALPGTFGGKIAAILEDCSKYHKSPEGKIDGWGRKWLP